MSFKPSPSQEKRRDRSIRILKKRNYLLYDGLLFTPDESEVQLREPREVATRALILWMVGLYADTTPQDDVLAILDQNSIWDDVSPNEANFLRNPKPDYLEKLKFKWRLEAAWILLWSLRKIWFLNWPDQLCDCGKMVKIFLPMEHWNGLSGHFFMRGKSGILDVLDLSMRQHWTATQTRILSPEKVDLQEASVVFERHYALNWLVNVDDESWDNIRTDT